jgi:peptidoglycan L-alanyl-D-glutamate endopeptidase CwlK
MRDIISLERCNLLHPKVREEAKAAIEAAEMNFPANIKIRVVQGLRTIDEQNALYAQGRTTPGKIVTKAKGGSSFHNYGLALDFALMYDKDNNGSFEELSWNIAKDFDKDGTIDWQEVVKQFEDRGWSWGGKWRTFKDNPHVEKTFDNKWQTLFQKYNSKDFIPNTNYVNI